MTLKRIKTENRRLNPAYANFIQEVGRYCWRCGRKGHQRPEWWNAPFGLERCHLFTNPRLEDRRVVFCACSLCHRIQHGDRFQEDPRKPLPLEHLIDLKRQWDPDYFDLEFLQKCSLRRLSG